ncbi:MAG TPA: glycosyltransferase family A protein [Candidatus Methylomirabilis sp.]|nr:glycosyltransferase family A protein [Candidatus Methylomirabilis sp.]
MSALPEVSAVVLSLGEPSTVRALESVRRQTLPVADIALVQHVNPFHRALNQGAARVTSPFFVQVDADMVLDPHCVEQLAACLTDTAGIVTGHLRDPLYGRIEAVKLFRTACVEGHPFRDSLSPDTDFAAEIAREGWCDIYALRYQGPRGPAWHTFGDHAPEYTPLYTYAKHVVEGRRWRYRQNAAGMQDQLARLHQSAHEVALIALIALAHGVFLDRDGDLLGRYREDASFHRLMAFLGACQDEGEAAARSPTVVGLLPKNAFRRHYQLGIRLGREANLGRFQRTLRWLGGNVHPWSFLAQLGLCHGLFFERYDPGRFEGEWTKLRAFRAWLEPRRIVRHLARELLGRGRRIALPPSGSATGR